MTRAEFARKLGAQSGEGGTARPVVIEERSPEAFRRVLADAAAGTGPVFLVNPDWGREERAEFAALVEQSASDDGDGEWGWLMIPTGGTSGGVKLARHDHRTIEAAVAGFRQYFGVAEINGVGVLPLHHVGGLMGWLRGALSGGSYRDVDWAAVKAGQFPVVGGGTTSISLVATQLRTLLGTDAGVAWLQSFDHVLLGGSAFPPTLLQDARTAGIRCVPGYGSTETMAMAAAQRSEDFLVRASPGLEVLPHVRIEIGEDERIELSGTSLFRGYWPECRSEGPWISGDRGRLEAAGRLQVMGRVDDLIVTGGEKVDAAEVERVMGAVLKGIDFAVVGVPDEKWGQVVVACYGRGDFEIDRERVEAELADKLAKFKWPKLYVQMGNWPLNAVGKLHRGELRNRAIDLIKHRPRPKADRAG